MKKEYQRTKNQGKKKAFNKVQQSHQRIRQGPYYICILCHRCLYRHSVRIFNDQKYILTSELHDPVSFFNGKIYVFKVWHKQFSKNVILYPIPNKLKDLHRLDKILISKRILFKKIAITHEKGQFS